MIYVQGYTALSMHGHIAQRDLKLCTSKNGIFLKSHLLLLLLLFVHIIYTGLSGCHIEFGLFVNGVRVGGIYENRIPDMNSSSQYIRDGIVYVYKFFFC